MVVPLLALRASLLGVREGGRDTGTSAELFGATEEQGVLEVHDLLLVIEYALIADANLLALLRPCVLAPRARCTNAMLRLLVKHHQLA